MVVVVRHKPSTDGKMYTIANDEDILTFQKADEYLKEKREKLMMLWGIDPVPDEPTPEGKGRGAERAFSVRNYGLNVWGDLFNSRQKLALITFVEKVRSANKRMLESGYDVEYIKAVTTYLGLILSRHSSYNASLCWWESIGERYFNVFGRQALPHLICYVWRTERSSCSNYPLCKRKKLRPTSSEMLYREFPL
ncbi:MAG: hypothetical protein AABZ77_07635 [Chloroflexota bacterium]